MEWREITTEANSDKCFHSAIYFNNKIYTFGGNNVVPAYVPSYVLDMGKINKDLFC